MVTGKKGVGIVLLIAGGNGTQMTLMVMIGYDFFLVMLSTIAIGSIFLGLKVFIGKVAGAWKVGKA